MVSQRESGFSRESSGFVDFFSKDGQFLQSPIAVMLTCNGCLGQLARLSTLHALPKLQVRG